MVDFVHAGTMSRWVAAGIALALPVLFQVPLHPITQGFSVKAKSRGLSSNYAADEAVIEE